MNNCDGLTVTGPLLGAGQGFEQKEVLLGGDSEESPVPSFLLTLFLAMFWGLLWCPS